MIQNDQQSWVFEAAPAPWAVLLNGLRNGGQRESHVFESHGHLGIRFQGIPLMISPVDEDLQKSRGFAEEKPWEDPLKVSCFKKNC